jgi:KDO2-lipid IV(A) lauroyltransferase
VDVLLQLGWFGGGGETAAADTGGLRVLLRALKTGGNIVILPDQVPGSGEGVWVNFFGKPAYTMTLLPRLAASTNAAVLFFFAERLAGGEGYRMHIEPMAGQFSPDRRTAALQTNHMVEKLVSMAPAQYLWGYNRYKHPAGAPLPESN